ncbi:MAG TPA: CmcI family methyltransferase [Polyangia bacterium]|nr:CmcI family methyltransferase [Polyangia bacterium]
MDLTQLSPLEAHVGYGRLGLGGELGYEGARVHVGGRAHARAISAHAPSRLRFALGARFAALHCRVAINDDVPAGGAAATFSVVADGRLVASVVDLAAGDGPRALVAPLLGARELELRADTANRNHCHAVWLDPMLEEAPGTSPLLDCLGWTELFAAPEQPRAPRCLATVAAPGDAARLDALLGSLRANGLCHDAALVVLAVGADDERARVALKYGATLLPGCPRGGATASPAAAGKGALFSIARAFDAERYLCLDPGLSVLSDLRPLFAAIDAAPAGSVLAVRQGDGQLDDGLFAGDRAALLALDENLRGIRAAGAAGEDDGRRIDVLFNLGVARMGRAWELDASWNVQLPAEGLVWQGAGARPHATWRGTQVRALRLDPAAAEGERRQRPPVVADPLPITGGGDLYSAFIETLRAWIGELGVSAMQWSFYGVAEGDSARVADSSVFPLLALLHYLVRSNGCTRILEAGTAAGVSAACLASAVAHRDGGRVVTFDPWDHPRRAALWSRLPANIRARIDERREGSIEGMTSELAAGRRYEAALLDSVHQEDHVWREFELAAQLVCPGGLILIHDVTFAGGTVAAAVDRIEAAGYGVTRLWTAAAGVREDDRLGLAVIENRLRAER